MSAYEGNDLREVEQFDPEGLPGMSESETPGGWQRFDCEEYGEAKGEEAYLFVNGHQVLISNNNDEGRWYVLAYPEQGFCDLMGFVRPLASDGDGAVAKTMDSKKSARALALGYMMAVSNYEADSHELDFYPDDNEA